MHPAALPDQLQDRENLQNITRTGHSSIRSSATTLPRIPVNGEHTAGSVLGGISIPSLLRVKTVRVCRDPLAISLCHLRQSRDRCWDGKLKPLYLITDLIWSHSCEPGTVDRWEVTSRTHGIRFSGPAVNRLRPDSVDNHDPIISDNTMLRLLLALR